MNAITEVLESNDKIAEQAQAALKVLIPSRRKPPTRIQLSLPGGHTSVGMPAEVVKFMLRILAELANGNTVTMMPLHAELTTQEAADLLNVSRPYLVTLVEAGAIPHRKVGTHRRLLCADVLAYQRREADAGQRAVTELTAEAQKLGLY